MITGPFERVAAIVYVSILFVTFGHAWNMISEYIHHAADPIAQFLSALVCAIGWPFYWSAWLWQ